MSYDVILIAALILPVLVFLFLRVNAALVFLSVCLGAVLVDHVAGDADLIVNSFSPTTNSLSQTTIELLLLLVPPVITAIIMALTVHGRTAAEYFRGHADWDEIAAIKPHLKRIPLIGNGDLASPAAGYVTGCVLHVNGGMYMA